MIKSFFVYLPSVLIPRLGAITIIIFGSHLLTPDQLGYLSLVTVIGEFAEMISTNWSRIAILRFGSQEAGVSRAYCFKMARIVLVCSFFALVGAVSVAWFLAPEKHWQVTLALVAYVLAAALVRFGVTVLQSAARKEKASAIESLRGTISIIAALLAMAVSKDFLTTSLVASAVNICAGIIGVTMGIRATNLGVPDNIPWKLLLQFALPLIILTLLSQLITSLDKALLKRFYDATTLGLYGVAFAIGRGGFDVIANSFNIGGFVQLSAMTNQGQLKELPAQISQQMAHILSISIPAAGVLIGLRDVIAQVVFPAAYAQAFHVAIPLVACGAIALNLKNFVYDNIFHLYLQNFRQIPTLVAGALATVFVGILLLPNSHLLGAGAMFAAGGVVSLAATVALTHPFARIPLPRKSLLRSLGIGVAVWAVIAFSHQMLSIWLGSLGALVILGSLGVVAIVLSFGLCALSYKIRKGNLAYSFITSSPMKLTGLSSYAASMLSAIVKEKKYSSLVFLTNADIELFHGVNKLDSIKIVKLPSKKFIPYKIYEPIAHVVACVLAALHGCSAYISSTPGGSFIPIIDQYVTIHDLYDIDRRYRPLRTVLYSYIFRPLLALVSKGIICVSQSTKDDLIAFIPFANGKTHVVLEASKFSRVEIDPLSVTPRCFLFVANVQPTKNVECLLSALTILNKERSNFFVNWIGRDDLGIVEKWIDIHGDLDNFKRRGSVSDEELATAYQQSIALLVPSFREGFCLPVLEAHAFGLPVIAADIPILHEVVGKGGVFFSPAEPRQLAEHMKNLASNATLRLSLSKRASENVLRFSWEKSARNLLSFVDNINQA